MWGLSREGPGPDLETGVPAVSQRSNQAPWGVSNSRWCAKHCCDLFEWVGVVPSVAHIPGVMTQEQLEMAKDRIDATKRLIGLSGTPSDLTAVRKALVHLRRDARARRKALIQELRKLDKFILELSRPWKAALPASQHAVLALLEMSSERVRIRGLVAQALEMFGLSRNVTLAALKMLAEQGVVRIYEHTPSPDHARDRLGEHDWIEIVSRSPEVA